MLIVFLGADLKDEILINFRLKSCCDLEADDVKKRCITIRYDICHKQEEEGGELKVQIRLRGNKKTENPNDKSKNLNIKR